VSFYGPVRFPCRRRIASTASRFVLFGASRTALQVRRKADRESYRPDGDAACGRRLNPTTARGGGRSTTTVNGAGRVAPERRTLTSVDCCRRNDGVKGAPPLVSFSSIPYVGDRSTGGLDAPTVLINRPRPSLPRRPTKDNVFPKAGMLSTASNQRAWRSLPTARGQALSITPRTQRSLGCLASGSAGSSLSHHRVPDSD
jgi:hypothetical protein